MITETSTVTFSCLSQATAGNWEPCEAYEHIHFFPPISVQHFVWTELNLVWHPVTHSSSQMRCLWSCSQAIQNFTNSVFFADLVDSPFFQIFPECPEQTRKPYGSLNYLKGKFLLWRNIYLNLLYFFPASELNKALISANVVWDFFSLLFSLSSLSIQGCPTHIDVSRKNKEFIKSQEEEKSYSKTTPKHWGRLWYTLVSTNSFVPIRSNFPLLYCN